ncbi:aminotransferase class I/II-fold pyridoxal phosphate-dependent enzyme [bacterium]|nr:aminotransferase class I/II-fold pyridoxal phosphate-dependent enzyme [bacterium]
MYFIGDEEIEALKKLFERKKLYRYQSAYESECDLFEKEFSTYAGIKHSLLLSSGTNALSVALLAAGLQKGDEVLIPAYTFVATAAAVVHAGGIPVIVNINSNLSMDCADAATKISAKTKALILVHMDGLVADVDCAQKLCKERNLIFIEDVAQAIGASFKNNKLGTYGDYGCFSLNENKNISCGEGGIVITNSRSGYEKAFCLHDGPAQFNPTKKDFFKEVTPFMGLSARVSEIQGSIMRVQLTRLEFILKELRTRKNIILDTLKLLPVNYCVKGYSEQGECASSLHLQFDSPDKTMLLGKQLREQGLMFLPVTNRPAHASWKWTHLLGDKAHLQEGSNPFKNNSHSYIYMAADYVQSVDILTRTLKMDIDIHLSLEETKVKAEQIFKILNQ